MMTMTFIAVNVIIFVAFSVRSFVGFGGALLCIPLLTLFYELKFIVPVECSFEIILSLILVPKLFRNINRPILAIMLCGSLAGSVVGIYVLNTFSSEMLKVILGVVVILITLNLWFKKNHTNNSISIYWGFPAGIIGGILGGMFGTSGPAYVAYLVNQNMEKHVFRATLIALFAIEFSWRFGLFIYKGLYTMEGLKFTLSLIPVLVIATITGHLLQSYVKERLFRIGVFALLVASGLLCFF